MSVTKESFVQAWRSSKFVQQDGTPLKLGKKAQFMLEAMVNEPHLIALKNINEVSEYFKVSPSTLTRLAKKLGFSGFDAFRKAFQKDLIPAENFYSQHVHGLLDDNNSDYKAVVGQIVSESCANAMKMFELLDHIKLQQAVEALVKAKAVYAFGLRQSYGVVTEFVYTLGMLRGEVNVLGDAGLGPAHGLAQVGDDDLLVLVGSSPHTRNTVKMAELAAQRKINVLAITDAYQSPLAVNAQCSFVIPSSGSFFSNQMGAFHIFMEGLVSAVACHMGDDALRAIEESEELISGFQLGGV
jgi:DNA-binding MurR/RpiR family transcriptional regulator